MKRIAAPMVGGMISSTILTLVVIPAVYALWKEREVSHQHDDGAGHPERESPTEPRAFADRQTPATAYFLEESRQPTTV